MPRTIRLISALALLAFAVSTTDRRTVAAQAQGSGVRPASGNRIYLVQMADLPAGSYTGGVAGLPATKAPRGAKIDPNSPEVIGYGAFLQAQHDQTLAQVGGARKVYDYMYSFNGFAAELSEAQADALGGAPGVVAVTKDELRAGDTSSTRRSGITNQRPLGSDGGSPMRGGHHIRHHRPDRPEHPSFSDRRARNGSQATLSYQQIPSCFGQCPRDVPASKCNRRSSAQQFSAAWKRGPSGASGSSRTARL